MADLEGHSSGAVDGGKSAFPNTRWSLVLGATEGSESLQFKALSELCSAYWYPLYAYTRRKGLSAEDAEDVTQGFFRQILQRKSFTNADKSRGKLRSYLITGLQNFITSQWRDASRLKRGGGAPQISIDAELAEERYKNEPFTTESPEHLFEKRWARELLDRVLIRVRADYEKNGKTEVFLALKGVFGKSKDAIPYAEIAKQIHMTEANARVAAFRLRKRFRATLREEIADTVGEGEDIDEELDYLKTLLSN